MFDPQSRVLVSDQMASDKLSFANFVGGNSGKRRVSAIWVCPLGRWEGIRLERKQSNVTYPLMYSAEQ